MDPVHIFYKEIKIDKDNIFTAKISWKMKWKMFYLIKIKNM